MYQNIFISSRTDDSPAMVYIWDDANGLVSIPYKKFHYAYKKSPSGNYTSIYGHRLKKITFWDKDDPTVFESDVPRETKVLTDLYLSSDEVSTGHNVGVIDIEVSSEGGFADTLRANKEVLSVAMHNQETQLYTVFVLDRHKILKDKKIDDVEIRRFDSEKKMFEAFMLWYSEQKFTILTGWNVAQFDMTYLYRRISSIVDSDTANMLSPIGMVKWSDMRNRHQFAGVSVLDYLEMYKKFTYSTRPNYRLDSIGLLEVDMGKVDLGMSIDEVYETDISKFLEYNIHDVRIVVALDKKLKLIELVRGVCHVGHVQYEDYMYSSKFIEGTLLTYLHRKNIICPNKPIGGREEFLRRSGGEEGFSGAYVKEPKAGLYEWVYSLDLQSLYPSIIMSLNISPETKIGHVENWDIESHMTNEIDKYKIVVQDDKYEFSKDEFISFMEKFKFSLSSNGILYTTDKVGIIPEILDTWFKERVKYRKLMKENLDKGDIELSSYYDRRQHIQKIFLNSIYGVLGLPIFRFYDLDNASAVTQTGQDVIKTSARFLNNIYQKETSTDEDYCIYIDTDSLYFSAVPLFSGEKEDSQKINRTIEIEKESEKKINDSYDVMAKKLFFIDKHRFHIRGETIAKTGFWITKKRYALLKTYDLETNREVNKVIIKGLDVVRSSFPPAFRDFMKGCLNDILGLISKQEMDNKVSKFQEELENISYLDIARNTSVKGLSKYDEKDNISFLKFKKGTPLHVKASLAYNRFIKNKKLHKKHTLIKDGDKVKYVYLKSNPYQIEAISFKGYDDPVEIIDLIKTHTDYKKLFDSELKSKLEDFYMALNWGHLPTATTKLAEEFFQF